jgi:hypothetical protein
MMIRGLENRLGDKSRAQVEHIELSYTAEYEYWVIRVWRKTDGAPLAIPLDTIETPPSDIDLARLVLFLG